MVVAIVVRCNDVWWVFADLVGCDSTQVDDITTHHITPRDIRTKSFASGGSGPDYTNALALHARGPHYTNALALHACGPHYTNALASCVWMRYVGLCQVRLQPLQPDLITTKANTPKLSGPDNIAQDIASDDNRCKWVRHRWVRLQCYHRASLQREKMTRPAVLLLDLDGTV